LSYRKRFAFLTESRVPKELLKRIRRGEYDLIIFNDTHMIPLVANSRIFTTEALSAHIHLDLHEYFPAQLPHRSPFRIILAGYHAWMRAFIGDFRFTTRSTVVDGIADLYTSELGIPRPAIVRNAPPFVDQEPTAVNPNRIKLLHHGVAAWARGLREIVDAMRLLDDRFTVTFMLIGTEAVLQELRDYSQDLGDRVRIIPPVPMTELAHAVNDYDLEILFYRPLSVNLKFALPNKLFEAIQGRIGLVVGESPAMASIVREMGNGVIVDGWAAQDLARTLGELTAEKVTEYKKTSHEIAHLFSAESERETFLATVHPQ
jgi:glycosyltransferase involved in cell wall biosynthesis